MSHITYDCLLKDLQKNLMDDNFYSGMQFFVALGCLGQISKVV